jgi:hypothetical protein
MHAFLSEKMKERDSLGESEGNIKMDIKEMVWSRFISRLGITGAVL